MFKESILGVFIPKDFREFAEKVAGKYNCQVQDISFKTEHKSNILRVTIDGEDTSFGTNIFIRPLSKSTVTYGSKYLPIRLTVAATIAS